jgi:hypothetical protein
LSGKYHDAKEFCWKSLEDFLNISKFQRLSYGNDCDQLYELAPVFRKAAIHMLEIQRNRTRLSWAEKIAATSLEFSFLPTPQLHIVNPHSKKIYQTVRKQVFPGGVSCP